MLHSTTPTTRTSTRRRAAVIAALALTAAFAAPAGAALAAEAPTLGAPAIIPAGQGSPIDVGGNDLHQHDVIRAGTQLLRWPVAMHGASKAAVTLACPTGTIHSGLGLQEGSDVAFGVVTGSDYFARTIDVRFYVRKGVDASTATGHVYALCRDTAIAPLGAIVEQPIVRRAGERSPVAVAGNHLHRGDRIRKGQGLLRFPVIMLGKDDRAVTLACPKGTVHRGLAFAEGSKISATVTKGSGYGHNTIRVRFSTRPGAGAARQAGSIYALCA